MGLIRNTLCNDVRQSYVHRIQMMMWKSAKSEKWTFVPNNHQKAHLFIINNHNCHSDAGKVSEKCHIVSCFLLRVCKVVIAAVCFAICATDMSGDFIIAPIGDRYCMLGQRRIPIPDGTLVLQEKQQSESARQVCHPTAAFCTVHSIKNHSHTFTCHCIAQYHWPPMQCRRKHTPRSQ